MRPLTCVVSEVKRERFTDRINAELRRGTGYDARTGEFESAGGLAHSKTLREVEEGKL